MARLTLGLIVDNAAGILKQKLAQWHEAAIVVTDIQLRPALEKLASQSAFWGGPNG
jgi:hypothetical protein